MPKVLITGGSGFIAGHCITLLLERGYTVVTTVRSGLKGAKVLTAYGANAAQNLTYKIVEDVAKVGAFDEVIKTTPNLDYVIHTTSPFHYNLDNPVKDFLEPAINGTTSLLKAVKEHAPSVKRLVLLSSFAALRHAADEAGFVYDESSWNPVTWDEAATNPKLTYQGSKALSEKAAWDFMEKEKPPFDLVTINPALAFGPAAPVLQPGELSGLNTSNQRILDMVEGKMKDQLQPTGFYSWVDVRDIAFAHVRALEVPEAANKRFLLIANLFTNKDIAEIVATMGLEFKAALPDDLSSLGGDIPGPKERYSFNNQRSIDVLGLSYRSLETSVKDTVNSLVKLRA